MTKCLCVSRPEPVVIYMVKSSLTSLAKYYSHTAVGIIAKFYCDLLLEFDNTIKEYKYILEHTPFELITKGVTFKEFQKELYALYDERNKLTKEIYTRFKMGNFNGDFVEVVKHWEMHGKTMYLFLKNEAKLNETKLQDKKEKNENYPHFISGTDPFIRYVGSSK